jgi:predicted peptidase
MCRWIRLLLLIVAFSLISLRHAASAEEDKQESIPIAALPGFLTRELVDLFEPAQFPRDAGSDRDVMNYRLFVPRPLETAAEYPLIVWLHGFAADELMYENLGQLKNLEQTVFRDPAHPEPYRFFFLVPQLPNGCSSWCATDTQEIKDGDPTHSPKQLAPDEMIVSIIDQLVARYPIDRDRISLCGVSFGGTGCWEVALRHPQLFAAVSPLASGPTNLTGLDRLAGVPVWAFHSAEDKLSPEYARQAISQLRQSGGCGRLTEIPGDLHNCWTAAFRDYDLLNWMLAQRRSCGCTFSWSQRVSDWLHDYWAQIVVFAVVGICALAWRHEARRRLLAGKKDPRSSGA